MASTNSDTRTREKLTAIVAGVVLTIGWQPGMAQEASDPKTDDATPDDIDPAVSSDTLATGIRRRRVNNRVIDELDLDATSITGNQELPKVMYILPWKQADLGDLVGRPVNSLLDEVLAPIDRDVFQRQMTYYDSLYGEDPADEVTGAE